MLRIDLKIIFSKVVVDKYFLLIDITLRVKVIIGYHSIYLWRILLRTTFEKFYFQIYYIFFLQIYVFKKKKLVTFIIDQFHLSIVWILHNDISWIGNCRINEEMF